MIRFRSMTYRNTRTAKFPVLFIAFAVLGVCTVEKFRGTVFHQKGELLPCVG